MFVLLILISVALPATPSKLLGYDCRGNGLNIAMMSLLDIGDCNVENIELNRVETYIQLMQLSDFDKTAVIQCYIEVDRTIFYCRMHSHVSIVNNGRKQYTQELGADGCRRLHETGMITTESTVVDKIAGNTTNRRSVMLAGRVSADGTCRGAQYTDGYRSWDNVVTQATIKPTLRTFEVAIKRTNEIVLSSGTRYEISARSCTNSDGSETYWAAKTSDSCHFDRYDILYEGIASKLYPKTNGTSPTIYTVTTKDTTFALTKTDDFNLCGYVLFRTEHPKLLILETQRGHTFKTRTPIFVNNLNLFS